jgi:hypothetical protein
MTINKNGFTEKIYYFKQIDLNNINTILFSIDNINWNPVSWLFDFTNDFPDQIITKVIFTTDLSLNNNDNYFICKTASIQIGSENLKDDGSRPIIYINGVSNYLGLINNGTSDKIGNNNIYLFNLLIIPDSSSTLYYNNTPIEAGGWLGQCYFGKNAKDNYVINCSVILNNILNPNCGGLFGSHTGSGSNAEFNIQASRAIDNTPLNEGALGINCDGLLGYKAGSDNGNVTCTASWTNCSLFNENSGGIIGGLCCIR